MENKLAPMVQTYVKMFEESEEASYTERLKNERDRDYYDGKQLTKEERAALEKRKQPPVVYNRIRRKVNFMLGLEKQSRRDPKAFPRNPQDDGAAKAATDGLRYVVDAEHWDDKRSEAWLDILVPGTGAIMVGVKRDKDGITPELTNIPWDRFFADPHSRRHDFSDASYMGIVTWYDYEEAVALWPDAKAELDATMDEASASQTYDDRPKWNVWADTKRKRVRVVEMYYKKGGQWHVCVFTRKGFVQAPEPSPYLDDQEQPENPIKAISLYVDRDNNRYGDVRDMIDPQDEINKRRSKGLHLISMRQARVGSGAVMEPDAVRRELAKPDGVIQGDDVEILQTNDMAAQNLQLLQEAKGEIDLQGANSALQGKNENDMSGRAILAQQQGGMVEVGLHMDRIRALTLAVYEAIWNRIRQFWKEPRWIRITNNERNLEFIGFNQPFTAGDAQQEMQEKLQSEPGKLQELQSNPQAMQQIMGLMALPAETVISVKNVPNEIDVDIIIDEGMDTPTIQAEQFETLSKVIPGIVNLPPQYAMMLVKASSLRDKDEMLEMLESMMQPDQGAAQAQQMEQAKTQAEIEKTGSEVLRNQAAARKDMVQSDAQAFETGVRAATG